MTNKCPIPRDILDDLCSRFIINVPRAEQDDPIRLFFQIELAHWFYLDFHRIENPLLKSCGMKEFAKIIIRHIPTYSRIVSNLDLQYENWKFYKTSVPTFGAIVLNEDFSKVLLVQSYFEKTSWGFPKGKVNKDEDPVKCASREVLEETGFDISNLINENVYIEAKVGEQTVRLYVIIGVKETEKFHPKTRKEIKNVEWFTINDLPLSRKDLTTKLKFGIRPNSFFMVLPFVKRIKNWILEKKASESWFPPYKQKMKDMSDSEITLTMSIPINNICVIERQYMENACDKSRVENRNPPQTNNGKVKQDKIVIRHTLISIDKEPVQIKCSKVTPFSEDSPIQIPRWLNFKLDKEPLIHCFDI